MKKYIYRPNKQPRRKKTQIKREKKEKIVIEIVAKTKKATAV